jgi:DNA-binding CsgD family transcriptional regulator
LVHDGRAGGAITSAIDALTLLAGDGFRAGRWAEAERLAREGIGLAESHGYQLAAGHLQHTVAMLAAARGDDALLGAEAAAMDRWAGPRGAGVVLASTRQARAFGAVGRGDFELGYRLLTAIDPPAVFAGDAGQALPVLLDLIQAAAHTNRVPAVAAELSTIHRLRSAACSPRMAMIAWGAAAIVSSGRDFVDAFENALTGPGADQWPFDLARVRLAYGARLRRAHAMVQARAQLTAALDVFADLGAGPWAVQAETELLATGMTRSQTRGVGPGSLTHQERSVAELAAAGLSNKQIAHRLVISPRTVSAHLRQVFPKLGITSRASIGDAIRTGTARRPS